MTLKGSHICTQNDSNQLETTEAITNAESFNNSFICEKSSRLELCPHQIYENNNLPIWSTTSLQKNILMPGSKKYAAECQSITFMH
ncbi:hypothetical protein HZS_7354 [Henneguya salminicola]|nr:hypothetical protein HZS_7354 [Henneguya salminicola]